MNRPSPIARSVLLLAAVALTATSAAKAAPETAADKVEYNRDVRPILSDNCFYCHGPDKNKRKGKFRLDDRESSMARGAIVPGKPDESTLVERIVTEDKEEIMPPPEAHKTLSAAQKDLLRRWVAQGAEYQPHWAYITPRRPAVPQVKAAAWVRNPIDAFVARALEAKQIAPSAEADRRTLLRRLSLDLIGLPPTPAEVETFVNDTSPDAYEKQVDRLLASPHYGERMAVPWLDAARFADTVGFHGDQNVNVFPYRDYVIDAFNHNKPFDQFTVEQLAGDLLPNPTTEQLVATGFNRLNMMTREGGAQPKEYLAKYAADRVRTIGSAFLGSTFACCECHDHKFDPIAQKDFYSLAAYFADVRQWGVYMDYKYSPNPDFKGATNDSPFPPEIVVDSPYLQRRAAALRAQIDERVAASANAATDDKSHAAYAAWREATAEFLRAHPTGWAVTPPVTAAAASPKAPAAVKEGATVYAPTAEDAALFTGKAGGDERVEFTLPAGAIAAIRLELLPNAKNAGNVVRGAAAGAIVQVSASIKRAGGAKDAKETKLAVHYADADRKDERYSSGHTILGVADAWKTSTPDVKSPQTAVYVLTAAAQAAAGDRLVLTFAKNASGAVRASVSPVAPLDPIDAIGPAFAASLAKAVAPGGDEALARRTYLVSTASDAAALADVRRLHRDVLECRNGKSPTLVTVAQTPFVTRILPRGNWQDETGAVVTPAPPHFVPPTAPPAADGAARQTRLDLAKWLVARDNPLTSRVIVNRYWKQFFGAGLCGTVDDFGAQGEPPSHPELLDWLAVEFRDGSAGAGAPARGWDTKHVVRLMVTSAAYRQASNLRPELKDVDPANRLLASQNPRRLEAEFVRDNALAAAGLLNDAEVGGPSVKPYQPEGYYANIQFPNRVYAASPDDRQWRRGLYTHWQRTFLHPMLANFDAPSREDTICIRNVSNTPQQALTLLNDPEFVEAARALAQRVMASAAGGSTDDARLDAVFQRVLSRSPRDNERQSLGRFLAAQRDFYKADPAEAEKLLHVGFAPPPPIGADGIELAAWANVCRVVLNLHETITRY